MRPIGWAAIFAASAAGAAGAAGCGALSGIGDFEASDLAVDASLHVPPKMDGGSDAPISTPGDEGEIVGDDVSVGEDTAAGDDAAFASDRGVDGDDGAIHDAEAISDVAQVPDGYTCGVGTCGGCCTAAGDCVGGQSVSTCGTGGSQCKNCASQGACNSSGTCAAPVLEAGPPPPCSVSSCTNTCSGAPIQGKCCKTDNTCGCQWTAFEPCN